MSTPKKVISVLQSGYLPYPGFFELMARCDAFVIYDDVQYDKNSWRNRNRIRGPQGPIWLTVPVLSKGRFGQTIQQIRISNAESWRAKHFRSLCQYYSKSKYFEQHMPFFENIYKISWENLVDLNRSIVDCLVELLGISAVIVNSSALKAKGEKNERLIEICKELGADGYISTNGAMPYLDEELFAQNKIKLAYQNYSAPEYCQGYTDFIGNLSVVDLLFHCGPKSTSVILSTSHCPFNERNNYRGLKADKKKRA